MLGGEAPKDLREMSSIIRADAGAGSGVGVRKKRALNLGDRMMQLVEILMGDRQAQSLFPDA